MTLCVDTGVFLAYADEQDDDHAACLDLLDAYDGTLVTTELVVAETGWLIERQLGPLAEAGFYRAVADDEFIVEPMKPADWRRLSELTQQYADNGLGGVDSSLVAVAERLLADTIATLDHRHFRVVWPRHVEAFTIVP